MSNEDYEAKYEEIEDGAAQALKHSKNVKKASDNIKNKLKEKKKQEQHDQDLQDDELDENDLDNDGELDGDGQEGNNQEQGDEQGNTAGSGALEAGDSAEEEQDDADKKEENDNAKAGGAMAMGAAGDSDGSEGGDNPFGDFVDKNMASLGKLSKISDSLSQLGDDPAENLFNFLGAKLLRGGFSLQGTILFTIGFGWIMIAVLLLVVFANIFTNIIHRDNLEAALNDLARQKKNADFDITVDEAFAETAQIVETGLLKAYNRKKSEYEGIVNSNYARLDKYDPSKSKDGSKLETKYNTDLNKEFPVFRKDKNGNFTNLDPTESSYNKDLSLSSFQDATNRKAYAEKIVQISADYSTALGGVSPTRGNDKALLDIVNQEKVLELVFALRVSSQEFEKQRYGYEYELIKVMKDVGKKQTVNFDLIPVADRSGEYIKTKDYKDKVGYKYVGSGGDYKVSYDRYVLATEEIRNDKTIQKYIKNYIPGEPDYEEIDQKEAEKLGLVYYLESSNDGTVANTIRNQFVIIQEEEVEEEVIGDELKEYTYTEYANQGVLVDGEPTIISDYVLADEIHKDASPVVWMPHLKPANMYDYSLVKESASKIKKQDYYEFTTNFVYDKDSMIKDEKYYNYIIQKMYEDDYVIPNMKDKNNNSEEEVPLVPDISTPNMEIASINNQKVTDFLLNTQTIYADEKEKEMVTPETLLPEGEEEKEDMSWSDYLAKPENKKRLAEKYPELNDLHNNSESMFIQLVQGFTSKHEEELFPEYGLSETSGFGAPVKMVKPDDQPFWKFWVDPVPALKHIRFEKPTMIEGKNVNASGVEEVDERALTIEERSNIYFEDMLEGLDITVIRDGLKRGSGSGSSLVVSLAESEAQDEVFMGIRYFADLADSEMGAKRGYTRSSLSAYDWCVIFVQWLLVKAGIAEDTDVLPSAAYGSASVPEMVTIYSQIGKYYSRESSANYVPKPGDFVINGWYVGGTYRDQQHIGVVTAYDASTDTVTNVSGNTSSDHRGFPQFLARGSGESDASYSSRLAAMLADGDLDKKASDRQLAHYGAQGWVLSRDHKVWDNLSYMKIDGYISPDYPAVDESSIFLADIIVAGLNSSRTHVKGGSANQVEVGIMNFNGSDLNTLIKRMYEMKPDEFTSIVDKHNSEELMKIAKGELKISLSFTDTSSTAMALKDLMKTNWAYDVQYNLAAEKAHELIGKQTVSSSIGKTSKKFDITMDALAYMLPAGRLNQFAWVKFMAAKKKKVTKDKEYVTWFEDYVTRDYEKRLDRKHVQNKTNGEFDAGLYEYEDHSGGGYWEITRNDKPYRQSNPVMTSEEYQAIGRVFKEVNKKTTKEIEEMFNPKEDEKDE